MMKNGSWPETLKRREFLALCGIGGVLAACQQVTPSQESGVKPALTSTQASRASDADWAALAKRLQGPLVRPGSAQYTTAHQLFDPRFDSVQPAAIAYCTSAADIKACLSFAQRFKIPLVPRSGGHSYAGYSTTTGLIVDVTRINTITVNSGTTATIGAGARLIDIYAALAQHGLALPGGSCPTVGIAGLTMGGGVGVIGRKFGLTSDNLLSAQIILADGRELTCNASQYSDLFWALRGGGGGNFGIVKSFTFQVHPVTTLSNFSLTWPWSAAASVVDAWQHWAPQAPDELWSNCVLLNNSTKSGQPIVLVNGVYVGPISPLSALLQTLTRQIDTIPASNYVGQAGLLDTMLYEAGCSGKTVSQCHLASQTPDGRVPRAIESAKSDYFTSIVPRSGIDALVNAITTRQNNPSLGAGGIGMDAYGGAINRVPADATAFAHRNALFSAQYNSDWNVGDSTTVVTANHTWLLDTWQAMRPYASGAAYQNYVDPDLANWQMAYYGSNLARLKRVKAIYDPGSFFHFAQSIPPNAHA